jgi:alpha-L-rhamnosidase
MAGCFVAGSLQPRWAAAAIAAAKQFRSPGRLMCNLLPYPIGVDSRELRLSWEVPELGPSTMQSAYQVQIVVAGAAFTQRAMRWDSKRQGSAHSVAVPVPPDVLEPDRAYSWRVRVWNERGARSRWSDPQLLVTASQSQWRAEPIWCRKAGADDPAEWLLARCDFQAGNNVAAAWLKATALSPEAARQFVYRCFINGQHIGVGPVRSPEPDRETYFHCYDVTALVRPGANTLSALCYASTGKAFLAELTILYEDRRTEKIGTGPDWRVLDGSLVRPENGNIGGGYYKAPQEFIDARNEPVGWMEPCFRDDEWQPALARPAIHGLLPAQTENVERRLVKPTSVRKLAPGRWLFDFGQEVVAGIRLSIRGQAGQSIEVLLGEELQPDGGVKYNLRCNQTYAECWTLRTGPQQLEHWGYRAFRWMEARCEPDIDLTGAVEAAVLALPWRAEAEFSSANPDLDRVWRMCRYSIEALRLDLYQDTPTRERGPYEGDAIVNQLSEYAVQRSYALARFSTHFLLRRPTWPTEYRLQTPILAWRDYLATGDDTALARDYDAMIERQLLETINPSGLVEKDPGQSSQVNGDLVDWPKANLDGFVFTRVNTVVNTWQFEALVALENIARVLGKYADRERLQRRAERMKDAMNALLLKTDGSYRDGVGTEHSAQHATAYPLAAGITPAELRESAGKLLASQGMRMSVYGAQFLLDALFRAGEHRAAIGLMTSRERFSWLHMMDDLHATIAMEAWDPAIKPNTTFSHAWGTAPANVIPRHVVGVEVVAPGASHISIAPKPGDLAWFKATLPTIRGAVTVSYSKEGPLLLEIVLPPNVTAELSLAGFRWPSDLLTRFEGDGYAGAGETTGVHRLRPGRVKLVSITL